MPPIGCSILPYYYLGKIIITIYPDKDYTFNRAKVEIAKKGLFGQRVIYERDWSMQALRKTIVNSLLQDIFPELIENLTKKEIAALNADKGTLISLINDPWHKKAHPS
ncbi:MAG: hypothetical protein HY438_03185 [DPANN group archaeon]|nr:hypothetical protein [DPANN group archaeon]